MRANLEVAQCTILQQLLECEGVGGWSNSEECDPVDRNNLGCAFSDNVFQCATEYSNFIPNNAYTSLLPDNSQSNYKMF